MGNVDPYLISFSQGNTWNECKRKFAYDKVDKLPRISSWALWNGSYVHDQIEKAIITGEPSIVESENALAFLGSIGAKEIRTEQYVQSGVIDGIKLRGYVDAMFQYRIDGTGEYGICIIDWKTKSKKPDTPSEANWDQVNLYAYLTNAKHVGIFYPEHCLEFIEEADLERGKAVLDRCISAGKEILESNALEIKGDDHEYTINEFCFFCQYQNRCKNNRKEE